MAASRLPDSRWYALAAALLSVMAPSRAAAVDDPIWSSQVEPLLKDRCGECHNPIKSKSGLDLTSLQTILRGGERGAAVLPGRADDSNLFKFLTAGSDPHMPPKGQLTEDQVGLVKAWITKLPSNSLNPEATVSATNAMAAPTRPSRPKWIPPGTMPAPEVIDRFLELDWKEQHAKPAKVAADAEFVRRLYLDLIGRVPTDAERERFLQDRRRGPRARLIDELLASDEYARHFGEMFDVVLMGRRGAEFETQRRGNHWFDFLEAAFRENRPWNEVVRELIVARPQRPGDCGAAWYLYERKNNPQAMAEALAPVVFGVQIKCAQCHDHMIAREIKQAHYWGMVAAFNRTRNVETPAGPGLSESAIGGFVSFANLKKESQPAWLTFFNGRRVEEAWPKEGEKEVDAPEKYLVAPPEGKEPAKAPAVPIFSRRAALADAVTRDNPLLARAMVNRVWAILLGRGLVHPVDLMDSKHPPSHPDLLDWLARDFAQSDYDVRRLVRNIAMSRAYQLDSRPRDGKPVAPDTFAHSLEKPLSAEQLFRSLLVVTHNSPDAEGKIADRSEAELRRAFLRQFPDLFAPDYNATLQQAMFLSNSPLLDTLLAARGDNLTARLLAQPKSEDRARAAIQTVFGRPPGRDELVAATHYLEDRAPEPGTKQLLWALMTSAEFQTNH